MANVTKITTPAGAASAAQARLMKTLREGKAGYSTPPVPFPHSAIGFNETHYVVPVTLAKASAPDDKFTLPLDPRVAVSGGNEIAMREVAGGSLRGTVKELWRRQDWTVTISGMLMADEFYSLEYLMQRVVDICDAQENVVVTCDLLNEVFRITRLAVTSVKFDATDGEDNQLFTITAVSDDSYRLEVD